MGRERRISDDKGIKLILSSRRPRRRTEEKAK